jgi:hypothetical protein
MYRTYFSSIPNRIWSQPNPKLSVSFQNAACGQIERPPVNFNTAIINIAGGTAKSTFAKNGIAPLIPNSVLIAVEDWNSGDGKADLEIGAKNFYEVAAQINIDEQQSFVLDIGTSNSRLMLQHFSDLQLTREKIQFWIVPVRSGSKERIDTLRTISKLLDLQVDPKSIIVIAQVLTDVVQFDYEFGALKKAATEHGFIFAPQAVLFNEVFDLIKGSEQTVFDIARSTPDFQALRRESKGNEIKLLEIGNQMLIYNLAQAATRNLYAVFQSTPLAEAVAMEEVT